MRVTTLSHMLILLSACGAAHGQGQSRPIDPGYWAAMTVAMTESCIRVDNLLRKVCARAGKLPPADKDVCELPSVPFEARTARALDEYKRSWRDELRAAQGELARIDQDQRDVFEKHYGHLRSGGFRMMELVDLHRSVTDCDTVERRMLRVVKPAK